jgi:glycosyltransferase involved in cell wall biosynthesis
MPFFSILIPCYNGAKTLPDTLNSVCAQTFKDFEVIVVNDGSTDASLEILNTYSNRLPMKIVSQSNAGLGAARNTGILNSSGEFVAFLDADDIWFDEKLQRVYEFIVRVNNNVDVVCHYEDMQENGASLGVLQHGPYTSYYDLLFKGNTLSPSATCVRRSMLHEVGLFSLEKQGHGAEDWDIWLKLAKNKARTQYINDVLGIYVMYGENMSEAPDFHERARYVFESHVSKLTSVTLETGVKIRGARAIHELNAARSFITWRSYKAAAGSLVKALSTGLFNSFFWGQVLFRLCSAFRRRFT